MFQFSRVLRHSLPASFFGAKPNAHKCNSRNSHRDTFKCATTHTTPPPNPPPGLDLPPTPIGEHLLGTWELVCRLSLVECTCSVWPPSLLVTCLLQVMVLGVVLQAWAYSWSYEKSFILKVCVNWTPFYSGALYLVCCLSLLCTHPKQTKRCVITVTLIFFNSNTWLLYNYLVIKNKLS